MEIDYNEMFNILLDGDINVDSSKLKEEQLLYNKYFKIEKILFRIKKLKEIIKNEFIKDSVSEEIKKITGHFNKKDKDNSNENIIHLLKFIDENTDENELFDYTSETWNTISQDTCLSKNKCFNLWINKVKKHENKDFNQEELIDLVKSGSDWITISKTLKRPPFELFKMYKKQENIEKRDIWSKDEDAILLNNVSLYGESSWKLVAENIKSKNPKQCLQRYRRKLRSNIKTGRWTKEEDLLLLNAFSEKKIIKWTEISKILKTRTDSQCRERYANVLNPQISREKWSLSDDEKLLNFVKIYGIKKWSTISSKMRNRTDAQCRRRYYKIKNTETTDIS